MASFDYAEVEIALAAALDVSEEVQRGPFRARLKHFQRLGLPGIKVGKGARVAYSEEHVAQLLVGLFLSEAGIDPTAAIAVIKQHWKFLALWVKRATDDEAAAGNPVYLSLRPRLMGGVTAEWLGGFRRFDHHVKDKTGRPIKRDNVAMMLERGDAGWLCVRNLSAALIKLRAALPKSETK